MRVYICSGCGHWGEGDRCEFCGSNDVDWTELSSLGEDSWRDRVLPPDCDFSATDYLEVEDNHSRAEQYQDELQSKELRIEELQDEVHDMAIEIRELEENIESLEEKIEDLQEQVDKKEVRETGLSEQDKQELLEQLAEDEGFETVDGLIERFALSSVVPGICKNPNCGYTLTAPGIEPDSDSGWCEECENQTVVSCLVLAGII